MYPIPVLTRDIPGYRITPHTDTRWKGITVQLYLPRDDNNTHIGTIFHDRAPDGSLPKAMQMRFAPNTGYAFAVGDNTWHSADPVGRLVLGVIGRSEPELVGLSDHVCTGLQLVNFLQDVPRDLELGRVYLPAEDRRTQRAGLIMAAIYRATLAEIEHEGFKVLTQRTSLTPLRKLWLAWKTWVSA